jgi:hypothetical protein
VSAEQLKHVLSLTSNDRFEAPDETLETDFLLQRAVTFQYERRPRNLRRRAPTARTRAHLTRIGKQDVNTHI